MIGKFKKIDNKLKVCVIVLYDEFFDIMRFRECEFLYFCWVMFGLVGVIVVEVVMGIFWVDVGKVEFE